MIENDVLNEKVKITNKYRLPLCVIGVLLVILIGITCFLYLNGRRPKDTYIKAIELFASGVNEVMDNTISRMESPIQTDYNFSFDLKTTDDDGKKLAEILNKMGLSFKMQMDYSAKVANVDLGVDYNNNDLLNAWITMNDKDMYGNMGELYNKSIKLPVEDLNVIWKMYNTSTYKTIVNELVNILKDNLKDDYFTSKDETIDIYGKSVKTKKHVMTLTGQDLYDIEIGMLNDVLENKNLIKALTEVSGMTENEIKESIEFSKEDIIKDEDIKVIVEIYLKGINVEQVVISDGIDTISFTKEKENEEIYEIKLNDSDSLGEVTVLDNNFKLNIDYDDTIINYEMLIDKNSANYEMKISLNAYGDEVVLEMNETKGKGEGIIKVVSVEDDLDLLVDFNYEISNIKAIDNKDVSNYIELDNMTDDDYNIIMNNVYQNSTIMTLMQDIMSYDTSMNY